MSFTNDGDRLPAIDKDAFECQRCGVFTTHTWYWIFARRVVGTTGDARVEDVKVDQPTARDLTVTEGRPQGPYGWKASQCFQCKDMTVWYSHEKIWPKVSEVGLSATLGMPPNVLELYEEGRQVAAISRRAGAALMRAALESLVKLIEPSNKTLFSKIGIIRDKVSPGLAQALDVLRDTGNGVLHDDVPSGVSAVVIEEGSVNQSAAFDYLCGVVNRLTEELITGPAQDERLFGLLPESVRSSIERRDSRG